MKKPLCNVLTACQLKVNVHLQNFHVRPSNNPWNNTHMTIKYTLAILPYRDFLGNKPDNYKMRQKQLAESLNKD